MRRLRHDAGNGRETAAVPDPGRMDRTLLGRRASRGVTRQGVQGAAPGREALTGVHAGRRRRGGRRGEQPMVPPAEFASYYGKPVLNRPVWASPDIPGYLFLGGLAGAGSLLGAGAQLTRRPALAKAAKAGSFGAACLSLAGLVHDLGRPARFLNMLRVLKVTSPMSVGSWLLAGYVPATGVAAAAALSGRLPRLGATATAGAALLGPAVAAYTGALISDTAVPAWHDGYREMPFVFVGSGAMAAGGLALIAAPLDQSSPARAFALLGLAAEASSFEHMDRRMGMTAEPYHHGRAGAFVRAGQVLSVLGAAGAVAGRRSRVVTALAGASFLAASAATRWGVFHAGLASADDPKYTVVPQRERLRARTGTHDQQRA
jgi:DMSO reductase anchor subunit